MSDLPGAVAVDRPVIPRSEATRELLSVCLGLATRQGEQIPQSLTLLRDDNGGALLWVTTGERSFGRTTHGGYRLLLSFGATSSRITPSALLRRKT